MLPADPRAPRCRDTGCSPRTARSCRSPCRSSHSEAFFAPSSASLARPCRSSARSRASLVTLSAVAQWSCRRRGRVAARHPSGRQDRCTPPARREREHIRASCLRCMQRCARTSSRDRPRPPRHPPPPARRRPPRHSARAPTRRDCRQAPARRLAPHRCRHRCRRVPDRPCRGSARPCAALLLLLLLLLAAGDDPHRGLHRTPH